MKSVSYEVGMKDLLEGVVGTNALESVKEILNYSRAGSKTYIRQARRLLLSACDDGSLRHPSTYLPIISYSPYKANNYFTLAKMATTAGQNPTPRDQSNGILPITASQTAGNAGKASAAAKSAGPRLKVVIRRLAPGLTETEFTRLLGDDWKLGQGRVDWFSYKLGKDSKEYATSAFNILEWC